MEQSIRSLLSRHNLRATAARLNVFEVLHQANKPLSPSQIATILPDVNRASVYRTISAFLQLGIITSAPHGWKQRYELNEPFRPHHHHLHCLQCNQLIEIHSTSLESLIMAVSRSHNFQPANHHFEVTGTCQDCRSN